MAEKIDYQKEKIKELEEAKKAHKIEEAEYTKQMKASRDEIEKYTDALKNLKNTEQERMDRKNRIAGLIGSHDQDGMREEIKKIEQEREVQKQILEITNQRIDAQIEKENQGLVNEKRVWEERLKASQEGTAVYNASRELLMQTEEKLRQKREELLKQGDAEYEQTKQKIEIGEEFQKILENQLKVEGEKSASLQNLENRARILKEEQVKLKKQYEDGKITLEEYNKKMQENNQAMLEVQTTLAEYKKGLDIIQDSQIGYMDKIAKMNALKLNATAFNDLLNALKQAELQAYNTARAVALALQSNIQSAMAGGV